MNAKASNDIVVGEGVMMGVNGAVFRSNHFFDKTNISIRKQRIIKENLVIVEDDVWIGNNSIIMSERRISKGTIVGAGSVVTKGFPSYGIIGGNPARLLRSRIEN